MGVNGIVMGDHYYYRLRKKTNVTEFENVPRIRVSHGQCSSILVTLTVGLRFAQLRLRVKSFQNLNIRFYGGRRRRGKFGDTLNSAIDTGLRQ